MRFVTDPRQARTVVMKDGSRYPVGSNGSFVITKAEHLTEMDRGNHDVYSSATVFGGGEPCECRRAPWPWETECPRCGRTLRT
jgi:hypothetical protein